MILSDKHIQECIQRGIFLVNPFNPEYLQPSSVDLHLGSEIKTLDGDCIQLEEDVSYCLKPKEFVLGSAIEEVNIPIDVVGHVDGRSSIGRLGVFIHVSSGFIDAGFKGNITLEIFNCSDKEFKLEYGESICQILFQQLSSPCLRPYGSAGLGSKFQGSKGTVESRL